jgi:hypothetical protein
MTIEYTNVPSTRGADCYTHHCLVVAIVRVIMAVIKQATQKFCGERFNIRKLNELDVRTQNQIETTDGFAPLGT